MKVFVEITAESGDVIRRIEVETDDKDEAQAAQTIVDGFSNTFGVVRTKECPT